MSFVLPWEWPTVWSELHQKWIAKTIKYSGSLSARAAAVGHTGWWLAKEVPPPSEDEIMNFCQKLSRQIFTIHRSHVWVFQFMMFDRVFVELLEGAVIGSSIYLSFPEFHEGWRAATCHRVTDSQLTLKGQRYPMDEPVSEFSLLQQRHENSRVAAGFGRVSSLWFGCLALKSNDWHHVSHVLILIGGFHFWNIFTSMWRGDCFLFLTQHRHHLPPPFLVAESCARLPPSFRPSSPT